MLNGDNIAQGGINYLPDGTRVPCVFRTPGCEIDFSTLPASFGTKPLETFAPDIKRPYQYEMNASVQRELMPGTSVTFSFFRRDYRNMIWYDNIAIDPSDYTKYTVQNPYDTSKTVDIYNLNPAKATAFNLLDQNSDQNKRIYTGYDIGFQSRLKGLNIFGGFSMGHTITEDLPDRGSEFPRLLRPESVLDPAVQPVQVERVVHLAVEDHAVGVDSELQRRCAQRQLRHGGVYADHPGHEHGGSVAPRDLERGPSHVPRRDGEGRL